MGKTFSFDRYTDAVRSAYKPHRDTGNSEEQREVLQKKIASLEKEFGKSISLSFTEMKRQINAVISLAVEEQYDSVIIPPSLNHVHPKAAIKERNRWMVENCNLLIAYVTHDHGGAATALRMAEKQGVEVFRI